MCPNLLLRWEKNRSRTMTCRFRWTGSMAISIRWWGFLRIKILLFLGSVLSIHCLICWTTKRGNNNVFVGEIWDLVIGRRVSFSRLLMQLILLILMKSVLFLLIWSFKGQNNQNVLNWKTSSCLKTTNYFTFYSKIKAVKLQI